MPSIEDFGSVLSLMLGLSVASERLVELIKGLIGSNWLNEHKKDPKKELRRRVAIQILATACGMVTAYLARDAVILVIGSSDWPTCLVLGLLASGGSGLWNALLDWSKYAKDIRKAQASEQTIPTSS
jgi:hypothetical protein